MLFRQQGRSLVVRTPAKLNLFLEILGVRSDGYHELETLMVSVGIYDTLTFSEEVSGKIHLRCFESTLPGSNNEDSPATVPDGGDNLVVQAAELVRKNAGVRRGVDIGLHKRIPVAAGLAGGSSDAAATLTALNRYWNLKLTNVELKQLAAQLGSDVSFFLDGSSAAVCRGRGEQVDSLELPHGMHFVVVRPTTGLSTAEVYRHCQPAENPRNSRRLTEYLQQGRLREAARCFYNALQIPAEAINPDIIMLKGMFSSQTVLGHMMSGSGTAYFGLCANRREALGLAARLRAVQTGQVMVVQSGP